MVQIGQYQTLTVDRFTANGAYLNDGKEGILLPKKYIAEGTNVGDAIEVFVYLDSEDRPIATTEKPKAVVGEVAFLTCIDVTPQGAFLDWGLLKDLFVPKNQQVSFFRKHAKYLVQVYVDAKTQRIAATEKFEQNLNNQPLTVNRHDAVTATVLRETPLGFTVAINNKHKGLIYHSDIFEPLQKGDVVKGYIKKIGADNKLDVMPGHKNYDEKIDAFTEKIYQKLFDNNGFLPLTDKSPTDTIYEALQMSKRNFKMAVGKLLKQNKIQLHKSGIELLDS